LRATNGKAVLTGLVAAIIVALVFPLVCSGTMAESSTTFTPATKFGIPQLNGSISFAVNGSCSSATLENDTWIFRDLRLMNSVTLGNLEVSAENSTMAIYSYRGNSITAGGTLRCMVQGQGTQTVNLGLNTTRPTHASEWYITIPGPGGHTVFLAEHEGWTLLPDNTVVVTGITGNMSITHYSFAVPNNNNLPFYQAHSVIIAVVAVLAITVAIVLVIRAKVRV